MQPGISMLRPLLMRDGAIRSLKEATAGPNSVYIYEMTKVNDSDVTVKDTQSFGRETDDMLRRLNIQKKPVAAYKRLISPCRNQDIP